MEFIEYEFLPVVLGGDITAYSLIRSFYEEYKIKSLAVNMSLGGPVVMSALCDSIYYEGLETAEVLLPALMEIGEKYSKDKKLLVIGCGDWYVRILIENKAALSKHYIIPYIDEELMNQIVLKDKFYEILEELDIPYPKTFVYYCKEKTPLRYNFDYTITAKTAKSALYHYARFEGK